MDYSQKRTFGEFIKEYPVQVVSFLILLNFAIRVVIYNSTELFRFSDYEVYLNGLDKIARGENQYLIEGNFLFLISYIGHFFQEHAGSLNLFFLLNCTLGSLTSLVMYFLVVKATRLPMAGLITVIIHTLYTEFMVFSSVFYTPVIMIFLVSLFLLFLYYYIIETGVRKVLLLLVGLLIVFLLTFFFKPELKYLPWFLLAFTAFLFFRESVFYKRIAILAVFLIAGNLALNISGIITHPTGNVISNSFIFFGHTDYGGDGGEGSFIYDENLERYEKALEAYLAENGIVSPTADDYNSFQRSEMVKYIKTHPGKWIVLQGKKFFRTFGVAPESTSFKVLYTGALRGSLILTLFSTVLPVIIIILPFILLYNHHTVRRLFISSNDYGRLFYKVWLLFFVYYLIASIFYGQYQERYRMPIMVLFIIPALAVFIVTFDRNFLKAQREWLVKAIIVVLLFLSWGSQAIRVLGNTERLHEGIRKLEIINATENKLDRHI